MIARTNRALIAFVAVAVSGVCAHAALAQPASQRPTPKSWKYEIDSRGNRVARDNRVIRPDGSWREEIRQGNCLTVKERSATGEYKETRQCNPGKAG
jgi:hypothetical protein